jgi:hypothetical protein
MFRPAGGLFAILTLNIKWVLSEFGFLRYWYFWGVLGQLKGGKWASYHYTPSVMIAYSEPRDSRFFFLFFDSESERGLATSPQTKKRRQAPHFCPPHITLHFIAQSYNNTHLSKGCCHFFLIFSIFSIALLGKNNLEAKGLIC